jgi:hypothetical protein
MNEDLFRTIKSSANGMLPVEVYEMLFDLSRRSSGGTCVEIGTALPSCARFAKAFLPQLTVTRRMKRWIANHIPFARAVYNKIIGFSRQARARNKC